jgi:hypothetical protein
MAFERGALFDDAVRRIRAMADQLGPSFGWKFLYCPSSLLSKRSRFWLIGINPGGTSRTGVPEIPAGNAYNLESWSPDGEVLRTQIVELFDCLAGTLNQKGANGTELLNRTLTSNFCPFHSDTWKSFRRDERRKALLFARDLWGDILQRLAPRVIFCMGRLPFREFLWLFKNMGCQSSQQAPINTGWGKVNFRIVTATGQGRLTTLVYLPHLSQIKLVRREASRRQVIRLCRTISESVGRP